MPLTRILISILACLVPPSALAAIDVRDDTGKTVRLAAPAARIVSLAPHVTELLFAAGAGGHLVAATRYSDYPPEATQLPRVGDAHAIDLERILALKPDLVVAWSSGNNQTEVGRIAGAGIPVFISEPHHADDIATTLIRLGRLAGTEAPAAAAAARFRAELAQLSEDYRGAAPYRLFYEIWHQPIMTLNGRHMVSDVLARCGARNVFAAAPTLVTTVSLEAIIAAAPQAIASGAGDNALAFWRGRHELPAVRRGRVCGLDTSRMHRSGPRLVQAARELCACLGSASADAGQNGARPPGRDHPQPGPQAANR